MVFRGVVDDHTDASLQPPRFEDVQAERIYRKQRLAAAYRVFARFGYDTWVTGHITVRDPEFPERFWVNPFTKAWQLLRASDMILVDADGTLVEGRGALNGAAFAIHAAIHHARPDVNAVAHAHSPHGQAWSATGQPILPLTQDCCAFFGDHHIFDEYSGVVYDTGEGAQIAKALAQTKAVLLRHHGLLTVGATVDEAAFWLHLLEQCCRTHLLLATNGSVSDVPRINDSMAALAHKQVGQPIHGWLGFQPLYERCVAEDTSFLT